MDTSDSNRIREIWNNQNIPVIFRDKKSGPLKLRLPFRNINRDWIQNNRRNKPVYLKETKHWEIPKAWFDDTIKRALTVWGKIYIIQPYRVQEVCAPACWNARGHECNCSCMGENHGSEYSGGTWFVVSDAFATKWGEKELACRLLKLKI